VGVGFEGSLGFGELIFWGIFGMSVGVAMLFSGTGIIVAVAFTLNLDFR